MRVLICGINYAPELIGIGKYTSEMAEWLVSQGYEVRVVTAPPYYPFWIVQSHYSSWRYFSESINKVKIFRCPLFVPRKPSGLNRLMHLISFAISSFPLIIWQSLIWGPDLIWVVEPPLFCVPSVLIASWLVKSKSWLHIQDFEVETAVALGLFPIKTLQETVEWFERKLIRQFDRVSTISDKMLMMLKGKGVEFDRCVKFQNWVNISHIYPKNSPNIFRQELKVLNDEIVSLYSGNFGEKQGLEIIIDSAKKLKNHKNIRFIICGKGSSLERLLKFAEGLPNIQFLPLQPLDRLNELLNLADIHLLPQKSDISDLVLPSKLTGMLASGRPVIATAHPGSEIASILKDSGLLVPPGDTDAFAAAILFLANNPKIRTAMGLQALSYVKSFCSHDKVLGNFEEELTKLID